MNNDVIERAKKLEEGDECSQCDGKMQIEVEGCSCHISPPCSACTGAPLVCDSCGYEQEAEPLTTPITSLLTRDKYQPPKYKTTKERLDEMPDGVFNYTKFPSTNGWGMTVKGKMPDDMTRGEILKEVGICKYGVPSFKQFYNGNFEFNYNYD